MVNSIKDSRIKPCRQCRGGHAGCKGEPLPDGKTQPQMLLAVSRGGSGSAPRWHFCPMSHWHERSGLHGKDPPAWRSGGRLRQAGPRFPAKGGLIKSGRASRDVNISERLLRAGSGQKAERNAGKSAVGQARSFPRTCKSGNLPVPARPGVPFPVGRRRGFERTTSSSCPGAGSCSWGKLSAVCAASPSLVFFNP